MNRSDARATKCFKGWVGEYRLMHSAKWKPVKIGHDVAIYKSAASAERAAWRTLHEIQEGSVIGETIDPISAPAYRAKQSIKDQAERIFRSVTA